MGAVSKEKKKSYETVLTAIERHFWLKILRSTMEGELCSLPPHLLQHHVSPGPSDIPRL